MECFFVHLQVSCEDFVKNIIDWLQSSIPCDDNIECPRELVEQMAVPVDIIEKADLEYDLMLGLLAHLDIVQDVAHHQHILAVLRISLHVVDEFLLVQDVDYWLLEVKRQIILCV